MQQTQERGLAPVGAQDAELVSSEQYQELLADCRLICEDARIAILHHMWTLGERIARDVPVSREETYGKRVMVQLEKDLAIDRTTLIRAVQTYRKFRRPEIGDGSSPMLTWGKLRMLVALDEPLFCLILARIRSGELRTDMDVHDAIIKLKVEMGLIDPPPLAEAQLDLFGIKGLKADKLNTIWRRAKPDDRARVTAALIPTMGLEELSRSAAVEAIAAVKKSLRDYERELDRGGKPEGE